MISGYDEYMKIRNVLRKLDLNGNNIPDTNDVANYVVGWGGMNSVMWDSNGVDEFEPTEDEEDALFLIENGYDAWMSRLEATLLGGEDEG